MSEILQTRGNIDIPKDNPNLIEAKTAEQFIHILNNTQSDPMIQMKITNPSEIIIDEDSGNSKNRSTTNTYGITMLNYENKPITMCYVVGDSNLENFMSQYLTESLGRNLEEFKLQINEQL